MQKDTKIIPIVTYNNVYENKSNIIKENKIKSGIYRLNNLITGRSYVGSSKDISNRFRSYYSRSYMERIVNKEKSIIYKSILKNGHVNFSLDILEYCEVDVLIKREQHYINTLKPEYNILKIAGSRLGHKLSEKTKKSLSISNRGKTLTYEIKQKISNSLKSKANILPKTKLNLSLRSPGVSVKVFDKYNNLLFEFPTLNSAAEYFKVSYNTMRSIKKRGASYDDYIYMFEVKDTRIWVYDKNKKLINTLNSLKKVSDIYNIPPTTISRYIKSGKLYKDYIYFYKSETVSPRIRKVSEKTKQLISNSLKNRLVKLLPIKVTNIETNAIKCFANNREAAKHLNISERTLCRYKSKGNIILKKFIVTINTVMHNS